MWPLVSQTMFMDQNLLYRSCRALIDGVCPPLLANRTIKAIRINMLYMSTTSPSTELVRLTHFVLCIYSHLWFESRLRWKATEAPLLYFKAMRLIAALPTQEKKVVLPTFERGFYWAHSENILLAMLASQEADIRARGVAKIFAIRDAEKLSGDREKQGKGRNKANRT